MRFVNLQNITVFHIHHNHTKHQSLFRLFIVIYGVPLEFKIFQGLKDSLLSLMIALDYVGCIFLRTNLMPSRLLKISCQWSKLNSTFQFKHSKLTMEKSTSRTFLGNSLKLRVLFTKVGALIHHNKMGLPKFARSC